MFLSALLLTSFLPYLTSAQLNTLAQAAGLLYFGTATDNPEITDPAYLAALSNTSDFGQLTPGNTQKWLYTEPSIDNFTYAQGDVITTLAQSNNQLLRCHNLVWYEELPDWVDSTNWTASSLTAALKAHITSEVTHYKGMCRSWDVVNEGLNDDGTWRNNTFYNLLGTDYFNIAFATAAAADPDAKLYYNDYNIEYAGAKATAAMGIVTMLQAAGVKIDGIGLESHFIVGETPSAADQAANMASFVARGVEVAVTELDVRMTLPATDALLAQQSTDYANTVKACVDTDGCVGVTVWDFDDGYSWVPSTFEGQGAADLMWANLTHKPCYQGFVDALTGA